MIVWQINSFLCSAKKKKKMFGHHDTVKKKTAFFALQIKNKFDDSKTDTEALLNSIQVDGFVSLFELAYTLLYEFVVCSIIVLAQH